MTAARRRRGRPRVCEGPTERVDVRVPVLVYDALCRESIERRKPFAELIREVLGAKAAAFLSVKNRQREETHPS